MRKLVLWGHHVNEYREMFGLSEADCNSRILEYGCGPSAINSELQGRSELVISCDPLFFLNKRLLATQVSVIFEEMVVRLIEHQRNFDFIQYSGMDGLIATRREGIATFFNDYEQGRADKRYLPVDDDKLPFADFSFDFALSSHYLFADLDDQDIEFHLNVIRELARVAKEVRIFPLIDRYGKPSPFLGPVLLGLQQGNYGTEVCEVTYHLQEKGNAMLRVWAQQCEVV